MAYIDDLRSMWRDQDDLNRLFRPDGPPTEYAARTALTKEMVLHLISETESLLRASGAWKPHRRLTVLENRPAILEELTDIHKYLITLYQVWGFTPEEAVEGWRRKTMVVRQRHAEEWVYHLNRPSVVVDLDQVLADYATGFMDFVGQSYPNLQPVLDGIRAQGWIDFHSFTTHLSYDEYSAIRHGFCVQGGFGKLPLMPGAKAFMDYLHAERLQILILTSRPIHHYTTVYTDTLIWLQRHELPFDFIWWTPDKGRMLLDRNVAQHVRFAVDDNISFVLQLAGVGVHTYWLNPFPKPTDPSLPPNAAHVTSLSELVTRLQGARA